MIDFTSALYLGLDHSTSSLRTWKRLTNGTPAALSEMPEAKTLARRLAAMLRQQAAALAPSTLHVFWDLGGILAGEAVDIFMDAGAYPLARCGAQRALSGGAAFETFGHHDAQALHWSLRRRPRRARRPVVFTDGLCPHCGRVAPLAAYARCVEAAGGLLVVDDAQALGVLGAAPNRDCPYGRGGGGSLPWSQVETPSVICVSSLAKALGVPLAVISGSQNMIEQFLRWSETRQHCSQPSAAALAAADHALRVNDWLGDVLRQRLLNRVRLFREILARANLWPDGGEFPTQTLRLRPGCDGAVLCRHLAGRGVRALWHRDATGRWLASFLVTARHSPEEIAAAATAVAAEFGETLAHARPGCYP